MPFPRTLLLLAVGGLYGMAAFPVVLTGTTVGGVLAFLTVRYLLADRLHRLLIHSPKLRVIANAIDSESFRIVALLRFGSPIPNAVQNYFFGLTRIGLWPYVVASFLFSIPQMALYMYLGSVGRGILIDDASSWVSRAVMLAGALCLTVVVLVVSRKARLALSGMG